MTFTTNRGPVACRYYPRSESQHGVILWAVWWRLGYVLQGAVPRLCEGITRLYGSPHSESVFVIRPFLKNRSLMGWPV